MIRHLKWAAIAALPLAAAAIPQTEEGFSRWKANTARHQRVIMHGVPEPYADLRDPSPDDSLKLLRGRDLFDRNCASCHGWSGQGTGPEGVYLVPAPADLEWLGGAPKDKADPYIYWTIAEGGQQFESEMPRFKHVLNEQEIWAVTAYLRAGMPNKSP